MRKTGTIMALLLVLIWGMAGSACNKADNGYHSPSSGHKLPVFNSPKNPDNYDRQDPLMDRMEKMSMQEKVGQLLMVGIEGYTDDAHI